MVISIIIVTVRESANARHLVLVLYRFKLPIFHQKKQSRTQNKHKQLAPGA